MNDASKKNMTLIMASLAVILLVYGLYQFMEYKELQAERWGAKK